MNWISVSFSIPYWLPTQEMVLAWCLLAMLEILLCAINSIMFDFRCQTAAAVFHNHGNGWWERQRRHGLEPQRAACASKNCLMAFLIWPIGLPKELLTFVFQARLDWKKDAERLERETRKPRRKAA